MEITDALGDRSEAVPACKQVLAVQTQQRLLDPL